MSERTLRWDVERLESPSGELFGVALPRIDGGWMACVGYIDEAPWHEVDTEGEARAWLEERAVEAGYDVERIHARHVASS